MTGASDDRPEGMSGQEVVERFPEVVRALADLAVEVAASLTPAELEALAVSLAVTEPREAIAEGKPSPR